MRQFTRADRLNQQMLRDISGLLEQDLAEMTSGMTTFTSVRLTKDLRVARVYYSYLGDEGGRRFVEGYFQREKKRIRSEIGKNLKIRHIPELEFVYDVSIKQGARIEELLNQIKPEQSDA